MNKTPRLMAIGAIVAVIALNPYSCFAEKPTLYAFDRAACYSNCGCDAIGMVAECFACKQECDRKFWAEFDKEMSGVENGSDKDKGSRGEDN